MAGSSGYTAFEKLQDEIKAAAEEAARVASEEIGLQEIELAGELAAEEAEAARIYESEQLDEILAYFTEYTSGNDADTDDGDSAAMIALEESIEQRGDEAQSELATELATRGIFASGPSAAASAVLSGETEASVAQARADYEEAQAQRDQQEAEAELAALTSLLGGFL